jgi:hypothetical protein
VQLGVGGVTKVFNWVSKVTSVGTTNLKDLWQTTAQDVETGTINIGTVGLGVSEFITTVATLQGD